MFPLADAKVQAPESILLDTSVIIAGFLGQQTHHQEAQKFLESLGDFEPLIVLSEMVHLEIPEACYKIALKEALADADLRLRKAGQAVPSSNSRNKRAEKEALRRDGRVRRRGERLTSDVLKRLDELLGTTESAFIPIASDGFDEVRSVMHGFGLASYDAQHAAHARRFGCEAIAAIDGGFADLPEKFWPQLFVWNMGVGRARKARQAAARRVRAAS